MQGAFRKPTSIRYVAGTRYLENILEVQVCGSSVVKSNHIRWYSYLTSCAGISSPDELLLHTLIFVFCGMLLVSPAQVQIVVTNGYRPPLNEITGPAKLMSSLTRCIALCWHHEPQQRPLFAGQLQSTQITFVIRCHHCFHNSVHLSTGSPVEPRLIVSRYWTCFMTVMSLTFLMPSGMNMLQKATLLSKARIWKWCVILFKQKDEQLA